VEHHDAAVMTARRGVAHDRRYARALPVSRVQIGERQQVVTADQLREPAVLADRDGIRGSRVRRPEQSRVVTGEPDDHRLRELELQIVLPPGPGGERRVCEGVIADLEPVAGELADDRGMARGLAADDEERGRNPLPLQHRRDPRCPAGVRTVIEGERDAPAGRLLTRDEPVSVRREQRAAE
jgi:hypothetical protein